MSRDYCVDRMRRYRCGWTTAVFCLVAASSSWATVLRVDATSTAMTPDGLTWSTSYRYLQDALAVAMSDLTITEVWIAQGTYHPDNTQALPDSGNRNVSFPMRSGLLIRGGFQGIAGLPGNADDNDPNLYESILSGDLDDNDVGDLYDPSRDENSLIVVNAGFGTDDTAELRSVTVASGHHVNPQGAGAGLAIFFDSHPRVSDCLFRLNRAGPFPFAGGGGIYVETSNPARQTVIEDCRFEDNEGNEGGGLKADLQSDVVVNRCVFRRNHASEAGGGAFFLATSPGTFTDCQFFDNTKGNPFDFSFGGGAGDATVGSTLLMRDCGFSGNSSTSFGGALANDVFTGVTLVGCKFDGNSALADVTTGGACYLVSTKDRVVDCSFTANIGLTAGQFGAGGAIYLGSTFGIITNSLFAGNQSDTSGAVHVASSNAQITNCTFADNSATFNGGGAIVVNGTSVRFDNCVLWDNTDDGTNGTQAAQIFLFGPAPTVTHSCVQDDTPGAAPIPFGAATNIDIDPVFVDPMTGDYRLQVTSPCLDAGDNTLVPADDHDVDRDADLLEPTPELNRGPRIQNAIATAGPFGCNAAVVDMGAYELLVDCNDNQIIDAEEIATDPATLDANSNGILDECEADCNENGLPDECEIGSGLVDDLDGNGIPDECEICLCLGDVNQDNIVDTNDITCFVQCQLAGGGPVPGCDCNCADLNDDGLVNGLDIQLFTNRLLQMSGPCPQLIMQDCNLNGTPDYIDFTLSVDEDCNNNGILDGCDINDGTSEDCNENGIPDECDIASGTSADVNANGIPDECECFCRGDVNRDGKVNADDGDPFIDCFGKIVYPGHPCICADMNGDGVVNGLDLAPFGARLECGPESCSEPFDDCNDNGVPDPCEIERGIAKDTNRNGIPDECECLCVGDITQDGKVDNSDLEAFRNCLGGRRIRGNDCLCADMDGDGAITELDERLLQRRVECGPNACGEAFDDCNNNNLPDKCDIQYGVSKDVNRNSIPDECECECRGDLNNDGKVNADDLPLIDDCINRPITASCACADMDGDGDVDSKDKVYLEARTRCGPDACGKEFTDCNQNSVPDRCDIEYDISSDTNGNGIPDECE